ncbi:hypothetical protein LbDm2_1978 [Levilactobacillus brevis]|uniref:hypothetical protein n=1 Tax=Levilactobacillus brevis TaxID=1580 RepID=UPI00057C97BC|nr:hypothetical protein [Levilactobacillus brevis]KID43135.1 hypothetical protein LbDm2_1978 [Levilactobacillus brevis]
MELTLDEDQLAELIAKKVIPAIMPKLETIAKEYQRDDDIVTQKYLYDNIFHCTASEFSGKYLSDESFPRMRKKGQLKFSKRAVNRWIDENQVTY